MESKMKWVYERAKSIIGIISPSDQNQMDKFYSITINSNGSLTALFSHYCCGDEDRWVVEIEEEDLHMSDLEINEKYRLREAKAVEEKAIKDEEIRIATEEKYQEDKKRREVAEYNNYLRLKKKFGGDS